MRTICTLKVLARLLIGLVFILSAVLKLVSIDDFEIYVFSFKLFSFNTASILARMLIAVEFFIGIALVIRLYSKQIWCVAFFILLGFTAFLAILAASGVEDNCHCFGNTFNLSPVNSIIKNVILLALLLFCKPKINICLRDCFVVPPRNDASKEVGRDVIASEAKQSLIKKYQRFICIALALICFVTPFILSPPDLFYHPKSALTFEQNKFTALINEQVALENITTGKKMVCFFSTECKFCKLAARKIAILQERHSISSDKIFYALWGSQKSVATFYKETNTQPNIPHSTLSTADFMEITGGSIPLIACLDNNKTIKTFEYRDIDEQWIVDFLTN